MLDKRHLVQNLARIAEEFLSLRGERESLSGAEKEGNAELFREDNARITREFYPDEEELLRDLAALRKGVKKALFHLRNRAVAVKEHAVLKMMIERAKIKVNGAAGRKFIVRDTLLRVHETRCVFVNPNARTRQHIVIGARRLIDHLLIRNAGRYDAHIHPALCGKAKGLAHLVCDDEIGRHKVDIALRVVYEVHVYILADLLAVER